MKLVLHNYWRSSASYRVRIALALKELKYDYVPVHLVREGGEQLKDAYLGVNAMAQVPTLEIHEPSGVKRIAQSLAICDFLDARFPETHRLVPSDPYLRAATWEMAEIVNSGIQPLQNLKVTKKLKAVHPDADVGEWMRYFVTHGFSALEARAKTTAGAFLLGDAPTLADVCLVPQMYSATRFGVDTSPFPLLTRIDARCREHPAFAAAEPSRQPDAELP